MPRLPHFFRHRGAVGGVADHFSHALRQPARPLRGYAARSFSHTRRLLFELKAHSLQVLALILPFRCRSVVDGG
ncbi:hypothetical protein DM2_451 [Halorubrum sp. DM2]|nr:hypothetical protein BN903_34 [Halorubrum sp. AJ67]VTT85569.1 hypothetical protein DM2_451 [Halorubrum sp. DM2]